MDALAFLGRSTSKLGPLYVLHGDEPFLKRHVLLAIRERALGNDADDSAVSTFPGDKVNLGEVWDELETVPFFSPKRLVFVENADPFVTKFRAVLEKKIEALPASGILVLDARTWAATTRLAKMVDSSATIVCKAPAAYKTAAWAGEWTTQQYKKQLPPASAQLLVELVGPDMGLLDQEILKLVIYIGDRGRIETDDVDRLVGNNRAQNTWKIFDEIAQGNTREALHILDRSFEQGEEPMRMLGAFAMQLRRLAQAARLSKSQGLNITAALERAGVPPFGIKGSEMLLRHLGRARAEKLYDWLLELNLDLRGNSTLPERTLFERFLLRLARKATPA